MKNIFYSSKDEIRNRILKNAQDYWGIKNTNDFDPLVKLLIEALSTELFNVSNDVRNLENRILDKISRILASDTLTSAIPAHAILHARPFEPTEVIENTTQFFYKKRFKEAAENSKENTLDVFFSPLKPVTVYNAGISFFASGHNLFQLDSNLHKTLAANTLSGSHLKNNTAYIGMEIASGIEKLNGISFYFDWKNYVVNEEAYDLLSLSKWTLNDLPLETSLDKFYMDHQKHGEAAFEKQDVLHLLSQDVHAFYSKRFLTIDQEDLLPAQNYLKLYPEEFEQLFPPTTLGLFKKPMIWLKIQFPAAITEQMLEEMHITVNAFPVVNKRSNEIKHRLKMMTNIIPVKLGPNDQFLCVSQLTDKTGYSYLEIPHSQDEESNTGSYSIRYGGTERLDTRNAKEVVDYLFELLRDEKAAFSAFGSDFLNSSLKDLEQNISIIEQKTRTQLANIKEMLNYIIVKPLEHVDIMFLDFWTTNAEIGNQIRSGSRLQAFENSKIIPESLYFLSNSVGGRSRLDSTNRVQAYKYGLTTGDRIVTKSDIVNFCFYELGNKIKGVDIRKGLMPAQNPKAGFVKTTDIMITPSAQNGLNTDEWNSILALTKSKLENRSIMNIHYRLLLN